MDFVPPIFDRAARRQRLARAGPMLTRHDALLRDSAEQLNERLSEVKRPFARALDLGPFPFLRVGESIVSTAEVSFDEDLLPFAPESFDLIAGNLGLQAVSDLPGALAQIRTCLRPDGLFIATLIGGASLRELRACLADAEIAVSGGMALRLMPTLDLRTASQLLQRAGFALPVADSETLTLLYPDLFALMRDLRGMGQTNIHAQRPRHASRRELFFKAEQLYQARFANEDGLIPASFEILHLHGWKGAGSPGRLSVTMAAHDR